MSHINLNPTYGALFIGVLVSSVCVSFLSLHAPTRHSFHPRLFGVTMLQTLVYFQQYPSDRAWRKLAVSWLWRVLQYMSSLTFMLISIVV